MYGREKIYTIWAQVSFMRSEVLRDLGYTHYWLTSAETDAGRLTGIHCTDIKERDFIMSVLKKYGIAQYSFRYTGFKQRTFRQTTEEELKPYIHNYTIDSSKKGLDAVTYID